MRVTTLFICALTLGLAPIGLAQSVESVGPGYDVVSIRRDPAGRPLNNRYEQPGRFRLEKGTIAVLVGQAYAITSTDIEGLPQWASTDVYDIEATTSMRKTTLDDRRAMKRALLADRFELRAHYETRDREAFDLVKARSDGRIGPGLVPYEKDCVALAAASREARANGDPTPDAIDCSAAITRTGLGGTVPMLMLAGMLQSLVGRPVVDKTGLEGTYRVKLEFDQPATARADAPRSDRPSLFEALPEQLGLKLARSRTQIQVLVVDVLERPAEN
jgi:uncharacterized protein (TIGR03435 family)